MLLCHIWMKTVCCISWLWFWLVSRIFKQWDSPCSLGGVTTVLKTPLDPGLQFSELYVGLWWTPPSFIFPGKGGGGGSGNFLWLTIWFSPFSPPVWRRKALFSSVVTQLLVRTTQAHIIMEKSSNWSCNCDPVLRCTLFRWAWLTSTNQFVLLLIKVSIIFISFKSSMIRLAAFIMAVERIYNSS